MYVKFNKIKFRNFMSYGNGWTEINFNSKLNIINAVNGSGKSSVVDAISYVLFGKPYREISVKSLVNLTNRKNMEVQIDFDLGDDHYIIARGQKPKKFEITKNGDTVDMLSSVKLNQVEVDKLIGIKYLLFKNVMCIGAISNVPFFNMCLSDRRELIETVFGLGAIADMLDEVKLRNSNNKIEFKTNNATKDGLVTSISNMNRIIDEANEKSKKFEENKAARIAKIQEHQRELGDQITKHNSNIEKCKAKLEEIDGKFNDISDLQTKKEKCNTAIVRLECKINDLKEKLSNRDKGVCPVCGTDLCSEHTVSYFDGLQKELEDTQKKLDQVRNVVLKDVESKLMEQTAAKDFYDKVKVRLTLEEAGLKNSTDGIIYDDNQIDAIKKEENTHDTTESQKMLDSYERQFGIVSERLTEISDEMAVDADLQAVLSDSGIKKYFFMEIVPIMNAKLNEYIKKFGLQHEVIFDDLLEYTITKGQSEMEYNALSNGEKTRVNVAMLLTFYDIAKQLSNWSCSILFMDEIFDTGIDTEGLNAFIKQLVEMLHEDGDLGVYLISHKLNELNLNGIEYETMNVRKVGVFSKIYTNVSDYLH